MAGRPGGCLGGLARFVALILAALLALTLPMTILAFDIGRVAYSAEEVGSVVIERGIDSGGLRRIAVERLLDPEASGTEAEFNFAQAMSFLEPGEIEAVYELLVPPDWARGQVSGAVESLYAWIDNDEPLPVVQLDLRPIQEQLAGGGAARLVETILDSWPACTVEQLEELTLAASTAGAVPLQYCEPPEPYRSIISDLATQGVIEMARGLPPNVDLLERDAGDSAGSPEGMMAMKEQLRLLRALARWGWLAPCSLLGLIMALAVRSLRGLTRWWGIPILLGGFFTLLAALMASGASGPLLARALEEPGLPDAFIRMVRGVGAGLVERVLGRMAVQGLLLLVGAAVLLGIGLLIGRSRSPRALHVAAAPTATPPATTQPTPPGEGDSPTGMFG